MALISARNIYLAFALITHSIKEDHMPQQNYLDELTPAFTPLLAIKEASRCLLCHDAPCSQACPAQTDPGKFIRSIYFRNFKGAAETIRENNALGAVCARVCPTEKLCQSGCTRAGVDAPIDIGRLQRFVTDFEQQTGMEIYQPGTKTLGKVAIIGAGPAGLQASVTLTNQGYDVTIYEKEAHPGGWLRNGIPQFRLPQSVLDAEIARIEKMGVTIKCNNEIGKTLTLEQLKAENRAVLVTVGLSSDSGLPQSVLDAEIARIEKMGVTIKCNNEIGKTLTLEQLKAENRAVLVTVGLSSDSGLPLFEHSDVEIAVDFLQRVRQAQGDISIPQSALIIGGGDVAMDVASTLKVLGCQAVTCVAREELDEFPASEKEFTSAQELGVSIIDGFTPVAVEGNKVTFKHVRLPGELTMAADKIILAVGQHARLDAFAELEPQRNTINTQNYQTRDPQVFAAGDIVEGDKTVVYAVKTGKEAAEAIHHYLEGACSC
ncbi:NAD(P)-dependent oxidoreductase [Escherichia coli]|nr:NAD(P)-dependent oxidoreductase [Escherichia coli]EHD3372577.1 NAD(P)-dependent oxidoreductase [Escherichia coli O124]EHD3428233.1 NAD(P)-dependent oxidoreductase [Escherichia coli O124]EHD5659327.1 NAD(P)-dependent oxidoreductase [Escherichia coli]